MEYSFDVEVAKEYGVDEAIMIRNFQFWISKNKANHKHCHDGRTWTYSSQKAFITLFPFWSRQNIRTILKRLVAKKVIITGDYNKNAYNHTTWYAFIDEDKFLKLFNIENQPVDGLELTTQIARTNPSITDIKTDKRNTDITTIAPSELDNWFENTFWKAIPSYKQTYKQKTKASIKELQPDAALREKLVTYVKKHWEIKQVLGDDFPDMQDPIRVIKNERWEELDKLPSMKEVHTMRSRSRNGYNGYYNGEVILTEYKDRAKYEQAIREGKNARYIGD